MSNRLGGTMKDISREEGERMWEEATPVEVERRLGRMNTVLSIRMTNELLGELEIAARSRGKGPTTLARELIEQGLALGPSASVPLLAKVASRLAEETARMARGRSGKGRSAKPTAATRAKSLRGRVSVEDASEGLRGIDRRT